MCFFLFSLVFIITIYMLLLTPFICYLLFLLFCCCWLLCVFMFYCFHAFFSVFVSLTSLLFSMSSYIVEYCRYVCFRIVMLYIFYPFLYAHFTQQTKAQKNRNIHIEIKLKSSCTYMMKTEKQRTTKTMKSQARAMLLKCQIAIGRMSQRYCTIAMTCTLYTLHSTQYTVHTHTYFV